MKKTTSTILAVAGSIAFLLLFVGGVRMSGLQSEAGTSLAEYYYRAMGTCMIGLSFVAAGLFCGLSWMVAVWPDSKRAVRTCPNCGTAIYEREAFCPICGHKATDVVPESAAAIPSASDKVVCPSCGYESPRGSRFCLKCGAPLTYDAMVL